MVWDAEIVAPTGCEVLGRGPIGIFLYKNQGTTAIHETVGWPQMLFKDLRCPGQSPVLDDNIAFGLRPGYARVPA